MKDVELLENGKLVFHSYDALKAYCDKPENPLDRVVLGKEIDSLHNLFECSFRTNEQFKGIEGWDGSNVKDMIKMFWSAENFNHPLNNWDVSNVKDMSRMFYGAFNQPLDNFSSRQKKQACYHFDEVKYKKDKANKNNSSSNSGYIDKVIKLAELREKGLLSEAEFEKMKEDLLK